MSPEVWAVLLILIGASVGLIGQLVAILAQAKATRRQELLSARRSASEALLSAITTVNAEKSTFEILFRGRGKRPHRRKDADAFNETTARDMIRSQSAMFTAVAQVELVFPLDTANAANELAQNVVESIQYGDPDDPDDDEYYIRREEFMILAKRDLAILSRRARREDREAGLTMLGDADD